MGEVTIAVLLVFAIIYFVPFLVYGPLSAAGWIMQPEGSPASFLLGVLVSKIGTAVAFVLIFYFAREVLGDRWLLYGFLWWLMFVIGEVGQAIGPNYSWREALAGMISETIYCPLAAWAMWGLLIKG
ncbi:MAG: hypothetical protein JSU61_06900 [Fidelibacterota bacterium]|nr:MAG: hypothetical protein JSU61_06900 [Candidatus Neomarinimicrobiota bacterium]